MKEQGKDQQVSFFIRSGLLSLFLILAVSSYLTTPLGSSDYFYHLWRGGLTGSQNFIDLFINSVLELIGVHSVFSPTLFDSLISQLELKFGVLGLVYFKLFLSFIFIFAVFYVLRRLSGSQFIALFFTFLLAASSLESPALSSDVMLYLCFAFVCLLFFTKNPKIFKILFAALFISYFLINTVLWSFSYELERGLSPQRFFDYRIAGLIMFYVMFLALHSQDFSRHKLKIFFVSLSTLFALFLSEFAVFAMIYLACGVAAFWREASLEDASDLVRGLSDLRAMLLKLPADGVIWIAVVLCILNIRALHLFPEAITQFPIKAIDHIVDNQLKGKMLTIPHIGSYINYRVSYKPERGQESDYRAIFYSNFKKIDPIATAQAEKLLADTSNLSSFIEAYSPKTILCLSRDALCSEIKQRSDWSRVFPEKTEEGSYYWFVYRRT